MRAAVVQEMHHRVKNNLQTVAMLLRLQMDDPKARAARPALQESINRILSIAAVHEILAGASLGLVDIRNLAERVAHAVTRNMIRPDQVVELTVGGDAPTLPSQPATSLALAILSEPVTIVVTREPRAYRHQRVDDLPRCLQLLTPAEVVERLEIGAGEQPPDPVPSWNLLSQGPAWWVPA